MKKLSLLLLATMLLTACSEESRTITVKAKVAVVYMNGDKDTIDINRTFVGAIAKPDADVTLYTSHGASCLVTYAGFLIQREACGVRKIQILSKEIKSEDTVE